MVKDVNAKWNCKWNWKNAFNWLSNGQFSIRILHDADQICLLNVQICKTDHVILPWKRDAFDHGSVHFLWARGRRPYIYVCIYIYHYIYTHITILQWCVRMCVYIYIYISLYIHQSILVGFVSVRVEKHPQAESPVKISADAVSFGPVWPMSKIGSQY